MKEIPYLGSLIADSGRMDVDVERRISQAFGSLRKAVFLYKKPDSDHQEEGFQGLCDVSAAVWI